MSLNHENCQITLAHSCIYKRKSHCFSSNHDTIKRQPIYKFKMYSVIILLRFPNKNINVPFVCCQSFSYLSSVLCVFCVCTCSETTWLKFLNRWQPPDQITLKISFVNTTYRETHFVLSIFRCNKIFYVIHSHRIDVLIDDKNFVLRFFFFLTGCDGCEVATLMEINKALDSYYL